MPDVLTQAAALDLVTDAEPRGDGAPADPLCPNCGAAQAGPYCPECGQRALGGRLTLRGLWREFASRVFNLDRGLLHTVTSLARSPGSVPCDYVEGRRRTYTNPLSFFLLAATLSLLTYGLYDEALLDATAEGFGDGQELAGATAASADGPSEHVHALTPEQAEREGRMDAAFEEVFGNGGQVGARIMFEGMIRYNTPLMLLLVVFLVPPLRVLFGPVRNVAEVSVFALYVVGFSIAVSAVAMPPLILGLGVFGAKASTFLLTVLAVGLAAWGAVRFYPPEGTAGAALRGAAAMTVAYGAYFVAVALFGGLYVMTHVLHLAGESWGSLLGGLLR